ncbi:MAG TPA: VWA domain-containing protein [Acidobacteriaceae bacterium]|nr:VWA domain-containing protein [Acidobacteriaceae bacterium]
MRMPYKLTFSGMNALVFACFLLPSAAHAQLAPSPGAPPPASNAKPEVDESEPIETLKVRVNLVSLYFTARDHHGALIPDLKKDNCNVVEDKKPQTLKNFIAQPDQPLTLGILLDTSGSQRNVLGIEQQAGAQFLQRVLSAKDEAFLISFDINSNLLTDYTNNARVIRTAMDKAEINTGSGGYGGAIPQSNPKGTVLYDAVYLASHDKLQTETGRKAMILLTDGEDQGSDVTLNGAIEAAQKADTIVYVLLCADRGFYGGGIGIGYTGDSAMRKLAEATGGRVITVGNNEKKLQDAFAQIEAELRTQYVASYTPTNSALDGSYRKIEIQCKQNPSDESLLKVQARKGYYAIPRD